MASIPDTFDNRAEPGPSPGSALLPAVAEALRRAGCVFAEDEARLLVAAAGSPRDLARLVAERSAGIPLEHLLGWAEFFGLRIIVAEGVFVPRRRTELLVRESARLARPGDVVVDLCCGSGAVGAAIAAAVGGVRLLVADIEEAAVACALENVGPGGEVYQGDLYEALPPEIRGQVAVLAVNAPYVPTDAIGFMPPEARMHEPRIALDGGEDGLDVQRRVAATATEWLTPTGHLLIETSRAQAEQTRQLMTAQGLSARIVRSATLEATVVVGRVSRRQAVELSGGSSRSLDPRAAV